MKTEMNHVTKEVEKKQWQKPALVELDVAMTRGGTIEYFSENQYSVNGLLHGTI